jgi:molybdate-binding protein
LPTSVEEQKEYFNQKGSGLRLLMDSFISEEKNNETLYQERLNNKVFFIFLF